MTYKVQGNPILVGVTLSSGFFAFSTFIGLVTALLIDISKDIGVTVAAMGQLTTVTAVSWSVLAPLIGPWSDRLGHKRMLIIGLFVFGISVIGYSVSNSFVALIVSSIFAGWGGAMMGPNVFACVADYYSASSYGKAMAATNVSGPLAYMLGVPGAVLISGSLGWRWSFLSLAVFYLLCLLAVVIVLPPSQPHSSSKNGTYLSCFTDTLSDKTFLPMLIANTILQAAYWVIAAYFAAFLILSYTLTTAQLAPLISSMAVGQLFGVVAGGPLADKCSKFKICLLSSIFLGITGLAFIFVTSYLWLSVLWGGLFMGFYGASRPAHFSLMALISRTAHGTVMGIQAVSNHLGRAAGAAVGGLVLSLAGYQFLGIICLILSLVAATMYLFLFFSGLRHQEAQLKGYRVP